jgi:signal transduction histidine kinase
VDTGITTMTAPLTLQQDENRGLGWVLYMPVYRGEPRSVDQRRDSLESVVFAPLVASELLATVAGEATVNADFRLYDEGAQRRLVFDAAPAAAPGERREIWHPMLVGDRVLLLQALSRPELSAGQGQGMPWLIGLVGGVLAGALALLTWRLVAGRQRAVARAESRLEAREHLLRTITDNLPARISYWNRDGRCLFANRRFREVYAVTDQALHDNDWSHGGRRLAGTPAHTEGVLRGTPQRFEQELPGATAGMTTWQVHYIPDGQAGAVKGFFVLANEVTELRSARDVAIEASSAKTRFLSSMSHEIRTPMNAILGMLTLLRGTRLDERQDDYADKAEGAARSLLSLLNDVLDFSKIEAGRMQLDRHPFSLEKMLADLSVILSANVGGKDIEVLYDLDPEVPDALVGDDMRLRQILINLGGNAVKFTHGGEVVLRTRLLAREGGTATIEFAVTDTGIGISEAEQHGLFDDYAQASDATARQFGGTGLGLSICRRLTELMGSPLHLASTPGEGSCFSFALTLPVAAEREPDGQQPACGVQRVLVVDDNPVARLTMAGAGACPALAGGHRGQRRRSPGARGRRGRPKARRTTWCWSTGACPAWTAAETSRRLRAGAAPGAMVVMVTGQGGDSRAGAALEGQVDAAPGQAGDVDHPARDRRAPAARCAARRRGRAPAQPLADVRLLWSRTTR